MDRMTVGGIGIAYELFGREGDPAVALTPGGRFDMHILGLREMADEFVAAGRRVLIYDRPNCGTSDACLLGDSESEMQAEALAGLIRALDLGPTVIAGGSGGSRVSMLAAARDPEICSHLAVWWISGDPIGLTQLATARGYDLLDTNSLDGDIYNVAGFGRRSDQGGSVGANLAPGHLRQGYNSYDFALGDAIFGDFFAGGSNGFFGKAQTTCSYLSDFDDGLEAQDASCALAVGGFDADLSPQYCNTGLGPYEVSIAPGDSGGPEFVDGKLASITSFGLTFGRTFGDIDNKLDETFGEFNGFVPIYHQIGFIDGVPEPSAWAMTVAGLGLVGAAMRRRRARLAFAR